MKRLFLLTLVLGCFFAMPARSEIAGLDLEFGQYSIFIRSGGSAELRLNGSYSDFTQVSLSCAQGSGRDIAALGNSEDPDSAQPRYQSAIMATLLSAYATQSAIQILVSDDEGDIDVHGNCGLLLVHLRCDGCPSGL